MTVYESVLISLLRRCIPILENDAAIASALTRHAPLPPEAQAKHDHTAWPSETLLSDIKDALSDY